MRCKCKRISERTGLESNVCRRNPSKLGVSHVGMRRSIDRIRITGNGKPGHTAGSDFKLLIAKRHVCGAEEAVVSGK